MSTDARLLDFYERELIYLRTAGQVFARHHPKVAERLELSADQNPDPHVERLIESFAFLTARVQESIEDRLTDVARNLLERLCPHYLRPVPSMTVLQFDPGQLNVASGYSIARGTRLFTRSAEGDTVRFGTGMDVCLWPIQVTGVQLITDTLDGIAGEQPVRSALKVTLTYPRGFLWNAPTLNALRFYVRGSSDVAAQLCDLMLGDFLGARWAPWSGAADLHELPDCVPRCVGLDAEAALLPERSDTAPAFRLLLEYFCFPQKFQFFDIDARAIAERVQTLPYPPELADQPLRSGELYLLFGRRPERDLSLQTEDVQLGCTTAINLFSQDSEPLRASGLQAQYPLVADIHRERSTEIYSIDSMATLRPNVAPVPLPEFYAGRHSSSSVAEGQYWYAQRTQSLKQGLSGTDMLVTFVDPDFNPVQPKQQTLVAKLTCTNRGLAQQLPVDAMLALEAGDANLTGKLLHKPSSQIQTPLTGDSRWRLAAQLSLSHLSLADASARARVQELLTLNNLIDAPAARRQIDGIRQFTCERVMRHIGDDPWYGYRQGYRVRITLDDMAFRGSSCLLFATVLHRFLCLFAGLNTFVELALDRGEGRADYTVGPLAASELSL
jgi:type VI secretion system protein ImpG